MTKVERASEKCKIKHVMQPSWGKSSRSAKLVAVKSWIVQTRLKISRVQEAIFIENDLLKLKKKKIEHNRGYIQKCEKMKTNTHA